MQEYENRTGDRVTYQQNKRILEKMEEITKLFKENKSVASSPTAIPAPPNHPINLRNGESLDIKIIDEAENNAFQADLKSYKELRARTSYNSVIGVVEAIGGMKLDVKRVFFEYLVYEKTLTKNLDNAIKRIGKVPASTRLKPFAWPIAIAIMFSVLVYSLLRPDTLQQISAKFSDPRAQALLAIGFLIVVIGGYLIFKNARGGKVRVD